MPGKLGKRLRIGETKVNILYHACRISTELKSVNSCKDLAVYVSRDLSLSNHVHAIVNKATKVVGLLKRRLVAKTGKISLCSISPWLDQSYNTHARYHGRPIQRRYKLAIEKVQRRALRIPLGQKLREMLYEERCILLNWNTLQHRREYLSVVEFSKTVSKWPIDFNDYFEFCRTKNTRANHP